MVNRAKKIRVFANLFRGNEGRENERWRVKRVKEGVRKFCWGSLGLREIMNYGAFFI